jgi:hypothetical protein
MSDGTPWYDGMSIREGSETAYFEAARPAKGEDDHWIHYRAGLGLRFAGVAIDGEVEAVLQEFRYHPCGAEVLRYGLERDLVAAGKLDRKQQRGWLTRYRRRLNESSLLPCIMVSNETVRAVFKAAYHVRAVRPVERYLGARGELRDSRPGLFACLADCWYSGEISETYQPQGLRDAVNESREEVSRKLLFGIMQDGDWQIRASRERKIQRAAWALEWRPL